MSNQSLSQLPHSQKLAWFQNYFRPHFEKWVVDPVEHVMKLDQGKMPAFVWITCAIEWLASYWHGGDTTGEVYKGFVNQYFPKGKYSAEGLWKSLRNGLVHMYTIKEGRYRLVDGKPHLHLGQHDGFQILNLEDFFADWVVAKNAYFDAVTTDSNLLEKLIKRIERHGFLDLVPS